MLHRVQQLVTDKAMVAPMYDSLRQRRRAPRGRARLGLIAGYAFSAPYEDLKLKAK